MKKILLISLLISPTLSFAQSEKPKGFDKMTQCLYANTVYSVGSILPISNGVNIICSKPDNPLMGGAQNYANWKTYK